MVGVTTNPSIFQKALSQVGPYDAQLKELGKVDVETAIRELTTTDVRNATDIFREIAEKTDFVDGRVSIEVDPRLAHETEATEQQAVELWEKVNRPNAMIKIPATLEGLPAITATLAKGISVNVTLIFLARALRAGHRRLHRGHRPGRRQRPRPQAHRLRRLLLRLPRGYPRSTSCSRRSAPTRPRPWKARPPWPTPVWPTSCFEKKFAEDPRWAALEAKGAKKQRPAVGLHRHQERRLLRLQVRGTSWSLRSSSTPCRKKTLNALADHGNGAPSIEGTYEESHAVMDKLAELGINIKDVTDKLEGLTASPPSSSPGIRSSPTCSPASTASTAGLTHRA